MRCQTPSSAYYPWLSRSSSPATPVASSQSKTSIPASGELNQTSVAISNDEFLFYLVKQCRHRTNVELLENQLTTANRRSGTMNLGRFSEASGSIF
ncbi:hypothetical protein VNO77_44605 [Canavalia gladiata]|uniref:Uncharacterized protein n=1 Tax=Canavalia gladiata TaxID=3824 RepID=A0AAN9JXB7_CANGL